MPTALNVIALISGGKDSFFSILHCLHHGHNVVALANLRPPTEVDEMDSMTYQTVGHNVVPLYQTCTGIPVYQHMIGGSTICDDQDYAPPMAGSDETEDLFKLLSLVRKLHSEANAVSTGAILSTYQRTRVESVVIRLGLVPLAYLWQYPLLPPPPEREDSSTGLLEDMLAAGCDARLIKIASFGISSALLGQSLHSHRTIQGLEKGFRRILAGDEAELRASVLGEGGEYETLTVNGPHSLWKQRICWSVVNSMQEGDVHYATIQEAKAEPQAVDKENTLKPLRIPASLDRQFLNVRSVLKSKDHGVSNEPTASREKGIDQELSSGWKHPTVHGNFAASASHISISNITALPQPSTAETRESGASSDPAAQNTLTTAGHQMKTIATTVLSILSQLSSNLNYSEGLTTRSITSTTLLLASMDDFAEVNKQYIQLFPHINPPARVTIATDLSEDVKVSFNAIIDLRPRTLRRSLHVQSRSYWAPANIGPYSQAIAEPLCSQRSTEIDSHGSAAELVSFAGQIPLIPVSMELAGQDPLEDTLLSLQHLWRVAQERKVDIWTWAIAYIAQGPKTNHWAKTALEVWREIHKSPTRPPPVEDEGDSEVDIWDRTHNRSSAMETSTKPRQGEHMHELPNWDVVRSRQQFIPPFIAAEVLQLPRGAPIEWWGAGLGRLGRDNEARLVLSESQEADGVLHSKMTYIGSLDEDGPVFTAVLVKQLTIDSDLQTIACTISQLICGEGLHQRTVVFGQCLIGGLSGWRLYDAIRAETWMRGVAAIPCRYLAGASAAGLNHLVGLISISMVFLIRTEI